MKKPGKKFTRIINWTVSGNLLLSSCQHYAFVFDESKDKQNQNSYHVNNNNISFELTLEDEAYLQQLAKLAKEMLSDRTFAKKAAATPGKYLKFEADTLSASNITLPRKELEAVIHALSDEEVADALNNRNIEKCLKLMDRLGVLPTLETGHYEALPVKDKQLILQSIGLNNIPDSIAPQFALAVVIAGLYVAVVGISFVVAAYTVLASVNMAVSLTVAAYGYVTVNTKVNTTGDGGGAGGGGGDADPSYLTYARHIDVLCSTSNLSTGNPILRIDDDEIDTIVKAGVNGLNQVYASQLSHAERGKLEQLVIINFNKSLAEKIAELDTDK